MILEGRSLCVRGMKSHVLFFVIVKTCRGKVNSTPTLKVIDIHSVYYRPWLAMLNFLGQTTFIPKYFENVTLVCDSRCWYWSIENMNVLTLFL